MFEDRLTDHQHIRVYRPSDNEVAFDPTRLVLINKGDKIINFARLEEVLRHRFHIQAEYSYDRGMVLIPTIANTESDFKALIEALFLIDFGEMSKGIDYDTIEYIHPDAAFTLRDAFYHSKEMIGLDNARGRISGEYVIPYPPGVPLIVPGEIISESLIEKINQLGRSDTRILGMEDDRIYVLKEDKC